MVDADDHSIYFKPSINFHLVYLSESLEIPSFTTRIVKANVDLAPNATSMIQNVYNSNYLQGLLVARGLILPRQKEFSLFLSNVSKNNHQLRAIDVIGELASLENQTILEHEYINTNFPELNTNQTNQIGNSVLQN